MAIFIDTGWKSPSQEEQHNFLPQVPRPPIDLASSLTPICLSSILVLNIDAKLKRLDDDGYIKFELPKNIDETKLNQSQILFETLVESIKDLCKGYSKYISMEVIE